MKTKTTLSRRAFFTAFAAPVIAATALAAAAVPTAAQAQATACMNVGGTVLCTEIGGGAIQVQAQTQLIAGNYQGYWRDGRALVEHVTVTPNEISVHRIAGGDTQGVTARFIRSGPTTYNSPTGHRIVITGPTTFTWTNNAGQNGVAYSLLQ